MQNSDEEHRQAAALNHLLGEIGLTTAEQTRWWNHVAYPELGDRTPTAAWLAGDIDGVTDLVKGWYDASTSGAGRAAANPDFLAMLRQKLDELDERVASAAAVNRSA
jgi:hypothetical protein